MHDQGGWVPIVVISVVVLMLVVLIAGMVWTTSKTAQAERFCLDAGYEDSTWLLNGDVYCIRWVDGTTETVLWKRALVHEE